MTTATTPKGERRRRALVAAAAEPLLEGGFEAVRHRSVASRADLPLASTTYYFESLDDLIAEVRRQLEADGARVVGVVEDGQGTYKITMLVTGAAPFDAVFEATTRLRRAAEEEEVHTRGNVTRESWRRYLQEKGINAQEVPVGA